jgi:hypothetical protein
LFSGLNTKKFVRWSFCLEFIDSPCCGKAHLATLQNVLEVSQRLRPTRLSFVVTRSYTGRYLHEGWAGLTLRKSGAPNALLRFEAVVNLPLLGLSRNAQAQFVGAVELRGQPGLKQAILQMIPEVSPAGAKVFISQFWSPGS